MYYVFLTLSILISVFFIFIFIYANKNHKFSRKQYIFCLFIFAFIFLFLFFIKSNDEEYGIVDLIKNIILFISCGFFAYVSAGRCRDIGISRWYAFLNMPVLGLAFAIYLMLARPAASAGE